MSEEEFKIIIGDLYIKLLHAHKHIELLRSNKSVIQEMKNDKGSGDTQNPNRE